MEVTAWVIYWRALAVVIVKFGQLLGELALIAVIIEFVDVLLNHNTIEHAVKNVSKLGLGRMVLCVVDIQQEGW